MSAIDPALPDDPGPDVTAAEYVLGVLPRPEHEAAARRAVNDPGFAAEVSRWEGRLTPLFAEVAPVAPPPSLWPAIAARLAAARRPARAPERARLWDSLAFWRGLCAAAVVAAAACIVLVVQPRPAPTPVTIPAPEPILSVARLDAPKGGTVFHAIYEAREGVLVISQDAAPAAAGKSHQLWLMPEKGAPRSLGVFVAHDVLRVKAPPGVGPGALLGVSLEPAGGSPTGGPTGPVVATGRLLKL